MSCSSTFSVDQEIRDCLGSAGYGYDGERVKVSFFIAGHIQGISMKPSFDMD